MSAPPAVINVSLVEEWYGFPVQTAQTLSRNCIVRDIEYESATCRGVYTIPTVQYTVGFLLYTGILCVHTGTGCGWDGVFR